MSCTDSHSILVCCLVIEMYAISNIIVSLITCKKMMYLRLLLQAGTVGIAVYGAYITAAGVGLSIAIVLSIFLMQGLFS